jgi:replicative DNA helicase
VKTLASAVRSREAGGRPLPNCFPVFDRWKIGFRRGEVSMIAGQPGAGKSSIALWHATQWVSRFGLRGVYFSADSSELVQAGRALAMVSQGVSTELAESRLKDEDDRSFEKLHTALDGLAWSFEPDITYEVIELELFAFLEAWGTFPDFIIVDNLTDVDGQAEDEWATLRKVMKNLVSLARETGAHVLVLHHVSEEMKEDPCPPRKALQGKVAAKQSLILTVGTSDGKAQPICPVKNRYAEPRLVDKHGRNAIYLNIEPGTFHYSGG